MDNYVMDFLVLDDKVQAIEINCYGSILIPKYFDIFFTLVEVAGPGLFDWDKDFERMLHGPCELRVIVDEAGTVQSL